MTNAIQQQANQQSYVQTYIVDNEGTVVKYKNKIYRISGMEMRANKITLEIQTEYKLVPVGVIGGSVEPLWVQDKSVTFLRS